MEISARREPERDRRRLLRCRSTEAPSTRTARSSTTCSTGTPSRSMRQPGKELWKTQVADMAEGETTPMAPFVVKNRVIVGASGGEFGIYGWIKGLDLKTGQGGLDRRATSAPTPRCSPSPAPSSRSTTRARSSARAAGRRQRGRPAAGRSGAGCRTIPSSTWSTTGRAIPSPYNPEQRAGDNKWTESVLARRPADGALVWAYQFTPHDNWDYDAVADHDPGGPQDRRPGAEGAGHFNKNGFQYTLDRATGEVLAAPPYVQVTWATGIDLKTGRPCSTRPSSPERRRAT